MSKEELEAYEELSRGASLFHCENCNTLIGEQPDNKGEVKPESILTYWRVERRDPYLRWIFLCTLCRSEDEFNKNKEK